MIKRLLKEVFKKQLSKHQLVNDTIKHLKNKEFTRVRADGIYIIVYKRIAITYDNILYPRVDGEYPGFINYLRLIKPLCNQLDYLELQDLQDLLTGKKEKDEECNSQSAPTTMKQASGIYKALNNHRPL